MSFNAQYSIDQPTRAEIDATSGAVVLEFGNPWCGYCHRAEPLLRDELDRYPEVRHVRIADAAGLPLGRSFGVKFWPTVIFIRDGTERARLIRPHDAKSLRAHLQEIAGDE